MNLRDALKLKSGDRILFSRESGEKAFGEVRAVTPRGGIKVMVTEGKGSASWDGPGSGPGVGRTEWIPYSRVDSRQS